MRIFVAILVLMCALFTPKAEAMRLDPDSHKMFSNPKYEKYMDVECYIVTWEQLGEFFNQEDGKITQLRNNQLRSKPIYLLVRCRNKGPYAAFGDLHFYVPNKGGPIPIEVSDLRGNMSAYFTAVMQIRSGLIEDNNKFPVIKYEWDCLYNY